MKILLTLICSLCLFVSTALAASDTSDRWLLVGKDSPNKNEWFIDNKTLKINDNKSVAFWAKVVLHNPKYDIKEIKLKYLLSPDQLQLTKLQEIGYSNTEEILWNNNTTKTISVIPGSGHEKLIIFIDDLIQEKAKKEKNHSKEKVKEPAKEQQSKTSSSAETSSSEKPAVTIQNDSAQEDKKTEASQIQTPAQKADTDRKKEDEDKTAIKKETL